METAGNPSGIPALQCGTYSMQKKGLSRRKHLKRIPVWLSQDQSVVYFVTACCARKRRVFEDKKNVRVALQCLQRIEKRLNWNILNVCFMPDHVHFLISPCSSRDQKLSLFVQRWKSSVTIRLRKRGLVGNIWQKEFFDRLLRSNEKLTEKWAYVRANPVRAGLCSDLDDYPFSGRPSDILEKL